MKAMILAAGVGSRLRPLTDSVPKALVEVGGIPMLEIVLARLIRAGCANVVINTFHLGERIEDFLKARSYFGIRIELSHETQLLNTGGGLKKVAAFFDDGQPFLLHNVDVLTDLNLARMLESHRRSGALATVAVQNRRSSRYLLFDAAGSLCGWESVSEQRQIWASAPVERAERLAFCGIHVISPAIFGRMTEAGAFSINQLYLRLAGENERILAFRADDCYWRDIGQPERLEAVRLEVLRNGLPA